LAEYFGVGFVENRDALDNVARIFAKYNRPLIESNKLQAMVPENCEVLLNNNGTAPGMWFNHKGKIYVSMPGVPFEMMYMMEEQVIPRLAASLKLPVIIHKTLLTAGEGESFLAQRIADIEDELPQYIKLAYLPKLGQVRLRLSGYGENAELLQSEVELFAQKIKERIGKILVAEEDIPLEKAILDTMAERGLTLSTAESCTGGHIASLVTKHAGSSRVFLGGAVSYSNKLKESILGVNAGTLQQYGAVSEQTVTEMAAGALKNFGSDYAIAVTGIAGPGGGTAEKPVGTVWIAAVSANKLAIKKFTFGGQRNQIIERVAVSALSMLITLLNETPD
ncbi:MAG: nicotinamide-nucleotide amidohydrolase family protein, partial [Mucilaginibacter sp.]